MEKRLRQQHEEDDRERKAREMGASNFGNQPPARGSTYMQGPDLGWMDRTPNDVPPPPKLTGMYNQHAESRAKPEGQGAHGGFRKSDVFGNKVPYRSGSLERSDQREVGGWNQFNRESDPRHGAFKDSRDMDRNQEIDRDGYPPRPHEGMDSRQHSSFGAPPPPFIVGRGKGYDRRF